MKHYSDINNSGYNWSSVPCMIITKRQKHPSLTKCLKIYKSRVPLENDIQLEASYLHIYVHYLRKKIQFICTKQLFYGQLLHDYF